MKLPHLCLTKTFPPLQLVVTYKCGKLHPWTLQEKTIVTLMMDVVNNAAAPHLKSRRLSKWLERISMHRKYPNGSLPFVPSCWCWWYTFSRYGTIQSIYRITTSNFVHIIVEQMAIYVKAEKGEIAYFYEYLVCFNIWLYLSLSLSLWQWSPTCSFVSFAQTNWTQATIMLTAIVRFTSTITVVNMDVNVKSDEMPTKFVKILYYVQHILTSTALPVTTAVCAIRVADMRNVVNSSLIQRWQSTTGLLRMIPRRWWPHCSSSIGL